MLKNIVLVVQNVSISMRFYHELFYLDTVQNQGKNAIMTEGLVLQDLDEWEGAIGDRVPVGHMGSELYFEEKNLDTFLDRVKKLYPDTEFLNNIAFDNTGRRYVRFFDPDLHIIEVKEEQPFKKNTMEFSLWLFAVKGFAQTYEMAKEIYAQLPPDEQERLKKEWENS